MARKHADELEQEPELVCEGRGRIGPGQAAERVEQPDDALSCGDSAAGTMLIQGDNLDALKSLMPYFAGRVKCVFIDPPYKRACRLRCRS